MASDFDRRVIEEFRANGRRAGELMSNSQRLLLLTTQGARSGQTRTTPMMFVADGERLIVIASNAGASSHPAWYLNLVAHPEVVVEVDGRKYSARASVLAGAERERVWRRVLAEAPFFEQHQAKIERQIPLVALLPA